MEEAGFSKISRFPNCFLFAFSKLYRSQAFLIKKPWGIINFCLGMISEGTREFLAGLDKNLFPNIDPNLPVHPTFFYEFLGNMIIFAFLLYYRSRAKKLSTIAAYFVGYGSIRFIVENLRTDLPDDSWDKY